MLDRVPLLMLVGCGGVHAVRNGVSDYAWILAGALHRVNGMSLLRKHCIKLLGSHLFFLVSILHRLHNLIHTWLLLVSFPKFKDSLVSRVCCHISVELSCLTSVVCLESVSQKVKSLEHHDVSTLRWNVVCTNSTEILIALSSCPATYNRVVNTWFGEWVSH